MKCVPLNLSVEIEDDFEQQLLEMEREDTELENLRDVPSNEYITYLELNRMVKSKGKDIIVSITIFKY